MLHHRYIVCFDVGVKSIIAEPVVFVLIVFEFSDSCCIILRVFLIVYDIFSCNPFHDETV